MRLTNGKAALAELDLELPALVGATPDFPPVVEARSGTTGMQLTQANARQEHRMKALVQDVKQVKKEVHETKQEVQEMKANVQRTEQAVQQMKQWMEVLMKKLAPGDAPAPAAGD